jgi:hypothetical protein
MRIGAIDCWDGTGRATGIPASNEVAGVE